MLPESRSLTTMRDLLHQANLDSSLSCGPMQAISFASDLNSQEYRLFEVTKELADQLITQTDSANPVEIKTEPTETNRDGSGGSAFLCTSKQTFSITEAETSNSLLLTSNWWLPSSGKENVPEIIRPTVNAVKAAYYELRLCIAPSLHLLKNLLRQSVYHGPVDDATGEDEPMVTSSSEVETGTSTLHPTYDELRAKLPCSQQELTRALLRLRACEVDGAVRILDAEYCHQVLREIFACADEQAWDWRTQGFPFSNLLDMLSIHHNRSVLQHICRLFFVQRRDKPCFTHRSWDCYLFPRNSAICQVVGEHLLAVTTSFDLIDFLAVWKATVPDGLKPKLRRHLTGAGRAYTKPYSTRVPTTTTTGLVDISDAKSTTRLQSISLLYSEDLPDHSVEARMEALFERSPSWAEAELVGYLTEVLIPPRVATTNSSLPFCPDEPLIPFVSSTDLESDFDYAETVDLDGPGNRSMIEGDSLPPMPSVVGGVLNRLCRSTNTNGSRFYILKHPKN